jgi:arabinogalactan endo-1,4-beta-galactosidase
VKTFVDPTAVTWNGCSGSTSGDKDHVIEYWAEAKAEGMGFLLDFHYSDVWADPGNQIIPEAWQDGYVGCRNAFEDLIADSRFDGIDFIVSEYNPQRTEMNLMIRDLQDGRGRGTFFWEPTSGGEWGPAMFTGSTANASDFQEYDDMLPELELTAW